MGACREPIEDHLDEIFQIARWEALRMKTNTYEADEVAQLTAYKLWRRWSDHKVVKIRSIGGARWKGYIRQVARNTYVDLVREHQRRLARQHRAYESQYGRPVHEGDSSAGHVVTVDAIEFFLARDLVAEEILRLPAQQRKVAERIFLLDMSVADVANELGLQRQTVRKHARAAREALKTRLSESEYDVLL